MVSIGLCVFIGIISFIVGSFSGICMICMCVVGGSGDESGSDSNIEEENSMRGNEEYKEIGKRCRGALYLKRHRVIKKPGRGYRCKYCDRILSDLRYEAERKKR